MAKRVLLLGTSFSAAPLLHFLKTAGMHVTVCGKFPHDPCVLWADDYHSLDYSDAAVLGDFVKEQKFSAICPSCNDYAYLSAAQVAQLAGYSGFDDPEATAVIADKARFRAFCFSHDIPVPRTWNVEAPDSAPSASNFPLLVKPVDSFSGRGVTRVDRPEQLQNAVADARASSRSGEFVVERFIEGTLHSHSAFLKNQNIAQDCFVDEYCTVYPYQVNCSNSPSCLNDVVRGRVREAIRALASSLTLCDGLLHTQFMVNGSDIYLIECMRRCPGDLFYHLISLSTSMPYVANYLRPFLGEDLAFPASSEYKPWARHTVSLDHDVVFQSFAHTIPGEEIHYFPLRESGSLIRRAPFDKMAILFARFDKTADLFKTTPILHQLITVHSMELNE